MADDYTNLLLNDDEPCILQSSYPHYDNKSLLINATKVPSGSEVLNKQPSSYTEFAAHPESFYTEPTYGSLPNVPGNSGQGPKPRRIIFCMHGKSSGCCSITEGEVIERPRGSGSASTSESVTQQDAPVNGHCHRERDENVDRKARKKLIIASVLCVIFMIGEVVGGYLSSSLAIATDAAHLLTDFASFMISLFSLWVASRPPTRRMSFGWYRAEVIGALTSVLMIWIITGVLVYLAIDRIVNGNFEIDSVIMLITSAVGVVVNIVMGFTLHQHSHSHSHQSHESDTNHSHQENINVRAAFIHVVGDLIQSLGVFIAALIIFFKPTWLMVDPICTFLFSALVLLTTFAILKDTIMVLMEGIPKGIDFTEVLNTFLQIDGVLKVHNLRIWALSLDKTALSAHLAIRPGVSAQNILTQASRRIHARFKLFEMTLQIEEFVENMEECVQCQCPEK